jgi:REP element-mobilizing transposase RayT
MQNIYHFVGRTTDRKPFIQSMHDKWTIETSRLKLLEKKKKLLPHAFVLMPNHFHLLAEIKTDFSVFDLDHTLSIRNFEITNIKTYREIYCYIYMNPVRAGLTKAPHHYPYSLLHEKILNPLDAPRTYSKIPVGLGGIEGEMRWISLNKQSNTAWSEKR